MDSSISSRRFEFLDGLRGIAALMVVLFHFNSLLNDFSIHLFSGINFLFDQGHCGVEIFFILSGFVIAYSIRGRMISFSFFSNFCIKRSIRLDPPFWVVLCVLILLTLIGNLFKTTPVTVPSVADIFINFFYMSDILEVPRILPVSWTLSLEIQFYLFLILVVKLTQLIDRAQLSRASLTILGLLMLASILQNTPYAIFPAVPGLFLQRWYSFFIGTSICWTMLGMVKPIFFWINFSFVLGYALIFNNLAFETCVISLLIYSVSYADKMHSLLKGPIFQYFGKISYSLYLIHWVVGLKIIDLSVRFFGSGLHEGYPKYLLFAFAFLMTILAADVFYRVVEAPSLMFSRKFKESSTQMVLGREVLTVKINI